MMFLFRHKNYQSKNDPRCDKNNFIFPKKKKKQYSFPMSKPSLNLTGVLAGLQLFLGAS